jgi:hypothetical protein
MTTSGHASPRPGSLSQRPAIPGADAYAQGLCQKTQAGELGPALQELACAGEKDIDEYPLLVQVRDVVVHELTRNAAHIYKETTPRAVDALGIAPLASKEMVVDSDDVLHLVTQRIPNEDAMGEELHTSCGQELWSDLESPLALGLRGSWQEPAHHLVTRCAGCAKHTSEFPAASERRGDPTLTPAVSKEVTGVVGARTRSSLAEQMAHIAPHGDVAAFDAAHEHYQVALTEVLSERASAGGDAVLEHILLRYYNTARRELSRVGLDGPLSELVGMDDWREAVGNTLEDLEEADNGAVAQSYLYGELRTLLGEKIRRERLLAQSRN